MHHGLVESFRRTCWTLKNRIKQIKADREKKKWGVETGSEEEKHLKALAETASTLVVMKFPCATEDEVRELIAYDNEGEQEHGELEWVNRMVLCLTLQRLEIKGNPAFVMSAFFEKIMPTMDDTNPYDRFSQNVIVVWFENQESEIQSLAIQTILKLADHCSPTNPSIPNSAYVFLNELLQRCKPDCATTELSGDLVSFALSSMLYGSLLDAQVVLDLLLPRLCTVFAKGFSGPEFLQVLEQRSTILEAAGKEGNDNLLLWQALLVGFCAATMENQELGRALIDPILMKYYDVFWRSIKIELISPDFKEQKRAMFLLKATLAIKGCVGHRWNALCDILESLDLMEVHHTKDNWSRVEWLMTKSTTVVNFVPTLDLSWIQLIYIKASKHGNAAVRKVPVKNFMEDWERYVTEEKYLRISPDFLFDTILQNLNERDLYRVIVAEDLHGGTRSLFSIEEKFPKLFRIWFEDYIKTANQEERRTMMRKYLSTMAKMQYGSNNSYALCLLDGLLQIPSASCTAWLLDEDVALLNKEFVGQLLWMAESVEFFRIANMIFKKVPQVVCMHGSPASIKISSLTCLLTTVRATNWPENYALMSEWVCSHSVLVKDASEILLGALQEGTFGDSVFFRVEQSSNVWGMLHASLPALEQTLLPITQILASCFSSPYMDKCVKRRAALLVAVLVRQWYGFHRNLTAAIDNALSEEVLVEIAEWCCQLVVHESKKTEIWLLEGFLQTAFSPDNFLEANISSDISDANYMLPLLQTLCNLKHWKLAENTTSSRKIFGLISNSWQSWLDAISPSKNKSIVKAAQSLRLIHCFSGYFSKLFQPDDKSWTNSVITVSAFLMNDFQATFDSEVFSRSAFWADCEITQWKSLRSLLFLPENPLSLSKEECCACVTAVVDALDRCSNRLVADMFEILQRLLTTNKEALADINWEELWGACMASFNSSERKSMKLYLSYVETVMHQFLFEDQHESQKLGALVRTMWQRTVGNDNTQGFAVLSIAKHCVGSLFINNPSHGVKWTEELLDLLEYSPERSTHQTAETQTRDLCEVVETPFDTIGFTRVHPLSFVRLQVLVYFDLACQGTLESTFGYITLLLETVLTRLLKIQAQTKKNSLNSPEGYAESHLWDLVCLLSLKLSNFDRILTPHMAVKKDQLLASLLDKFMSSSCNFRDRAAIEIAVSNILLSRRTEPIFSFLDRLTSLSDAKKSWVLSTLHVTSALAHEAVMGKQGLWDSATTLEIMDRIGVETLPFAGSGDIVVRNISGSIISLIFPALVAASGNTLEGRNSLLNHTGSIILKKHAGGLLSGLLLAFDPRVHASVEWKLAQPCNAYGEEVLDVLSIQVTRTIDDYLLDKHSKVRAVIARKNAPPTDYKSTVERESRKMVTDIDNPTQKDGLMIRQQKFDPWTSWSSFLTQLGLEQAATTRHREAFKGKQSRYQNLIVVTTLLDSIASIAALARTSEIFAARTLVVRDMSVMEEDLFEQIAVSAGHWLPIHPVSRKDLPQFLKDSKNGGFHIVGLEQNCRDSIELVDYAFPQDGRVVLVCSNEIEGIPVDVLQECNDLVKIPCYGVTKTLLAHISGAITVWEYTKQQQFGTK